MMRVKSNKFKPLFFPVVLQNKEVFQSDFIVFLKIRIPQSIPSSNIEPFTKDRVKKVEWGKRPD